MSLCDVIEAVTAAILSAGGAGVIIIKIADFLSEKIAERLQQKYKLEIDKKLEEHKAKLEGKIYITKTRFDTEFLIYRELSKISLIMVQAITEMIPDGYSERPIGYPDRLQYEENLYKKAGEAIVTVQNKLWAEAPFIPETLYENYKEILSLCREQLAVFKTYLESQQSDYNGDDQGISREDRKRSRKIVELYNKLIKDIRAYISSLDVIQ